MLQRDPFLEDAESAAVLDAQRWCRAWIAALGVPEVIDPIDAQFFRRAVVAQRLGVACCTTVPYPHGFCALYCRPLKAAVGARQARCGHDFGALRARFHRALTARALPRSPWADLVHRAEPRDVSGEV